jgi:hypothetical protein
MKNFNDTIGTREPATFRLVAQCLKHLRHRVHSPPPPHSMCCIKICQDESRKSKRNLKTLVIPTEIHSRYRPSTNPKAPYSMKYIGTCPVCQQVIFFSRIQTYHSCRYVSFLFFVTMATYLQSSDFRAADTQKIKLTKHTLVFLHFSLSILSKHRDASKYFQNVLLYYSISQLLWLSSWSLLNIPRHFVHVIFSTTTASQYLLCCGRSMWSPNKVVLYVVRVTKT